MDLGKVCQGETQDPASHWLVEKGKRGGGAFARSSQRKNDKPSEKWKGELIRTLVISFMVATAEVETSRGMKPKVLLHSFPPAFSLHTRS